MAKLLPLDEACKRLGGISRTTLWRLRKNGELPQVKLGGRYFVSDADLDQYIASLKKGQR